MQKDRGILRSLWKQMTTLITWIEVQISLNDYFDYECHLHPQYELTDFNTFDFNAIWNQSVESQRLSLLNVISHLNLACLFWIYCIFSSSKYINPFTAVLWFNISLFNIKSICIDYKSPTSCRNIALFIDLTYLRLWFINGYVLDAPNTRHTTPPFGCNRLLGIRAKILISTRLTIINACVSNRMGTIGIEFVAKNIWANEIYCIRRDQITWLSSWIWINWRYASRLSIHSKKVYLA